MFCIRNIKLSIFIIGLFRIFPNNNPKLFHSQFEKPPFSKPFQALENGLINFHNLQKLSKTRTDPDGRREITKMMWRLGISV